MDFKWDRCIICQKSTKEDLRCPQNAHSYDSSIYKSFLNNILAFKSLESLPVELKFDIDCTTLETLEKNSAKWHRSCHLKFSSSKLERAKERSKRTDCEGNKSLTNETKRPRRSTGADSISNKCIICDKEDTNVLHQFSTLECGKNLQRIATNLNDFDLLSRLTSGDVVAIEAKYHMKCLTNLRNRERSQQRKNKSETVLEAEESEQINESRAFVELKEYVIESVKNEVHFFCLSELTELYQNRLRDFGIEKLVNRTRLKNRILEEFPEAQEQDHGRQKVIVFKEGMKSLLKEALNDRDFSDDAITLAKAAKIVRHDMFSHKGFNFKGAFPPNCQETSVPTSLKVLISMILNGVSLKEQAQKESQPCLAVCQTILFNSKKRSLGFERHTREREPPLPIYLGFNIHSLTRCKTLITKMYQLGLSISYDRVMEIQEWLATAVSQRFDKDGCVVPANLKKDLFCVGALDNLDHNPSSTTAVSSFHGTAISVHQFPTENNPGQNRPPLTVPPPGPVSHSLPDSYAIVPPTELRTTETSVPCRELKELNNTVEESKAQEIKWVKHSLEKLEKENPTSEDKIGWSAYHSANQCLSKDPPVVSALLPIFYEKAATPAMVKHGMDVLKQAIEFLNPTQIPVIALDQPLFALAKMVQWKWPDMYGEDRYVIMFGGLHLESGLWNTLGQLLDSTGWTTAIVEADIASSGVADSFLKASHLTRTRHAHQVTVLTLHQLKQEAYRLAVESDNQITWNDWESQQCSISPTFLFWDMILQYETLILLFIRAHRDKCFTLYVDVLEELVHLFFSLDHVNYARWVPIHLRDMRSLPEQIRTQFEDKQHWVISKTNNKFSSIPIDQVHEQMNKSIKAVGGAVGLTENPVAFRRWMLSGPETARIIAQFEGEYLETDDDPENPRTFANHETGHASQRLFQRQVRSLTNVMRSMGNPFLDNFSELIKLDTRDCLDAPVAEAIRSLREIGNRKYKDYQEKVIINRTKSIHDTIKKNNLLLFKNPKTKPTSKQAKAISVLQNNVALFAQLYIAMQNRESDLADFFAHEVQSFPPSISEFGDLRLPSAKSDLLECLPCTKEQLNPPTHFGCRILDGAVIVHSLPTTGVVTFNEYADKVFIPHLLYHLQYSDRVDVVWDTYVPGSLKDSTRDKRGAGTRRKVSGQVKLPGNWMQFLRDSTNKSELFQFLTDKVASSILPPNKCLYITSGQDVVNSGTEDKMPCCNHEEADTRIIVHLQHALQNQEISSALVRTVDTDVVVILVGKLPDILQVTPGADVWVAFGMGRRFRYFSINAIMASLGVPKSRSLPVFHALTGCDTTSTFYSKAKRTAWQAWELCSETVTPTLEFLATHPFQQLSVQTSHFQNLERMIVVMYDKTSNRSLVNETRMDLFCRRNGNIDSLPPTQNALLHHTERAVFQAGIWTSSDQSMQDIPTPDGFGWIKIGDIWKPLWLTVPEVSKSCQELVKCSCKHKCTRCKCAKSQLSCTPLCKCECNIK